MIRVTVYSDLMTTPIIAATQRVFLAIAQLSSVAMKDTTVRVTEVVF